MRLAKIGSYLDRVEEGHEEAECKLGEVREGNKEAMLRWASPEPQASDLRATRVFSEVSASLGFARGPAVGPSVQEALEEARCIIELVKKELTREVYDDHNDEEEITCTIRRILEAEWRHEELEDALAILSSMSDSESDSDETEGDDTSTP